MARPSIEFAKEYFKNKDNLIIAEIGVSQGQNADDMYKKLGPKEFYLIDCYEENPGFFEAHLSVEEQQSRYQRALEYFKSREGITFFKERSCSASLKVQDIYFDFIYIDASHDELSVIIDIACWYPKLKLGGIIGGHDIGVEGSQVYKAVQRMFKDFTVQGCDWWAIKKRREGYV